jgi:hypothetical protein
MTTINPHKSGMAPDSAFDRLMGTNTRGTVRAVERERALQGLGCIERQAIIEAWALADAEARDLAKERENYERAAIAEAFERGARDVRQARHLRLIKG